MKNYHCTPHTYPPLPATNTHPLWATWDLAVDTCLRQLPDLLTKSINESSMTNPVLSNMVGPTPGNIASNSRNDPNSSKQSGDEPYVYASSRFFTNQLTVFEVWISRGGSALTRRGPLSLPQAIIEPNGTQNHDMTSSECHLVPRKPPDQLPIVLQVLLSQPHRLRALILLSQFVDLGPWTVHLVLTIGIFPYISKLLQAAGQDLRPVLIFIWARILAVDSSVQTDLYNTQGYKYFSNLLGIKSEDNYQEVATSAQTIVDYITALLLESPFGRLDALSNPGPRPPQPPPTSHNDSLVVRSPQPCPSLFTTTTNE